MFLVPTYLAPSPIHGVGVFTPSFIPAGTVIWSFRAGVDLKLEPDELEQIPPRLRERFRAYCYLEAGGQYVLCGDNARYMNHSSEPSCDDSGTVTRAARDIQPREELTCDYRAFDAGWAASPVPDYLTAG